MKRRGERPPHGMGGTDPGPRTRWYPGAAAVPILGLITATIAATAVGFWLSYAGLHVFAVRSGLLGPEAWAWPASVDLFILAGELGVTISAVRAERDKIAWAYLTGGFVLSVGFNVAHVLPVVAFWGRYAVAATPPVAAMLALAALMRQVFRSAATGADAVPARIAADAESAAAASLEATFLAGNPLSQNQLMERFGLSRAQARELRARVVPAAPTDPAVAAALPPQEPPRPATAALNGSAAHG